VSVRGQRNFRKTVFGIVLAITGFAARRLVIDGPSFLIAGHGRKPEGRKRLSGLNQTFGEGSTYWKGVRYMD